jgi:hypothetical protein
MVAYLTEGQCWCVVLEGRGAGQRGGRQQQGQQQRGLGARAGVGAQAQAQQLRQGCEADGRAKGSGQRGGESEQEQGRAYLPGEGACVGVLGGWRSFLVSRAWA